MVPLLCFRCVLAVVSVFLCSGVVYNNRIYMYGENLSCINI